MAQKKIQYKSACVFCGDKSPSNEHVFPQWLGKRLDYPSSQSIINRRVMKLTDGELRYVKIPKSTNHHISAVTTRKVCKKCNGEWLSQIESNTIPAYDKFRSIQSLDQHEQRTLACWAYLVALKWDLMEKQVSGYTPSHYSEFYIQKSPHDNTRVWIGTAESDAVECFHRTVAAMEEITDPKINNIRSTTLKIGTVVMYVLTHEPDSFEIVELANSKSSHKLKQIHPYISDIDQLSEPFVKLSFHEMAVLTKMCGMQHDSALREKLLGDEATADASSIYSLIFNVRDSLALHIARHITDIGLASR